MPRQVLESGKAYKLVKISRAPSDWDSEKLMKAVDYHISLMRKELQGQGKVVKRVEKQVSGVNGDMQITAYWAILGKKVKPKDSRRDATSSKIVQGESTSEPGPAAL